MFSRYGITLTITVASIMLSRLPEKIAVVLMGSNYGNAILEDKMVLEASTMQFNCGSSQIQETSSDNVIHPSWNGTIPNDDAVTTSMPYTMYDDFEGLNFLDWAGQWLMKLPIFMLSILNPWIYAYHNVDFKRCMNRYVRKILVGWKIIGQEAKSNAGIFATVKLDRSYMTTAQMGGSGAVKPVFCSLHYLSAAVTQGQPNVNTNVGMNAVCTCTGGHNSTLSPPPSPLPSLDYTKNVNHHMSSQRLNNIQSSLSRYHL